MFVISSLSTCLVVSGQSFFARVGFCAAIHLAPMNRIIRVDTTMSLQMFLPGKRLLAVGAVVDPLHLFSAGIAFLLAIAQVTLTLNLLKINTQQTQLKDLQIIFGRVGV